MCEKRKDVRRRKTRKRENFESVGHGNLKKIMIKAPTLGGLGV